jgi:ADP-heptose:LPS heptosyltransferase
MARSSKLQRDVDRILGIPIVFLVGLIRRQRSLPVSPRRIGIIQPSAIGDMVLISGLLLHLHRRFPNAEIHVFHGPFNGQAIPLLPVDVVAHLCIFTRPLATLRTLRSADLDILINCAPWTRLTALLTAMSRSRATVGFRSHGQYIHPAFDVAIPYLSDRHEVENHRAVAQLFGPMPDYTLKIRATRQLPKIALPHDRMILMHMCPGGSCAKQKSWPAENWVDLGQRLIEHGFVLGFTGADVDRDAVAEIVKHADLARDRCISLAGRLNLTELCNVLASARLLVTIDTGVAHLASALNIPVVGLYGPTRFERWGSRGARATGLNSPHPASGYINYGFEQNPQGDEIMPRLTPDVVFAAVMARLSESKSD